jgi:hypothetical protein
MFRGDGFPWREADLDIEVGREACLLSIHGEQDRFSGIEIGLRLHALVEGGACFSLSEYQVWTSKIPLASSSFAEFNKAVQI